MQIGTYSIALCAKAMNKPFYVLAESFKFVRLYPLNQRDMPEELKVVIFHSFNVKCDSYYFF
jgi:translation initiation factor eIF-2B subunit alpha